MARRPAATVRRGTYERPALVRDDVVRDDVVRWLALLLCSLGLEAKGAVVRWSDAEAGCRSDLHVMRAGSVFGWGCGCEFSYGWEKEWMGGGGAGVWAGGERMLQSGADEDQDEGGQSFELGRYTISRHLHDLTEPHAVRLRLDSAAKCRKNRRDCLYTCLCLLNRLREYKNHGRTP